MFIRKYKLKILEALVGNLRQENQKLKDKVKYRNILIKGADIQMKQLKEENADLRHEKDDAIETLKEIYKLAISNKYNNEKAFNNKIKELAETAIKTSSTKYLEKYFFTNYTKIM